MAALAQKHAAVVVRYQNIEIVRPWYMQNRYKGNTSSRYLNVIH